MNRHQQDKQAFVIQCSDMGSSSVQGVYSTAKRAIDALLQMVEKMNKRTVDRKIELDTPFTRDEISEEDGNVLLRYSSRLRVMEVREYEMNKAPDATLDWYDDIND